ncbi:MAG: beta-lactamase family protein [Alphaproteobacteria bacterium]|nr:beta-lactamase family protein [Alphaproteobacteria bacterium]MBU1525719.1 beta-lactamase family protein [Alphaproteobacteria bacterium]MBU2117602.1 beta-lactamase family protein [Alphaproteobacteria bacterium]MBU2351900.1 beta-lactamase family protein [Alphaproteobacteria bacterium]MBU2382754.1 beta-lactamase family protein [Alphaproteobacteria bacterium]
MPDLSVRWAGPVAALALGIGGVAGGVWWWTSQDRPAAAEAAAPPERPPVVVVEALPQLKAALDAEAARGRLSGAVLVARGDRVLFRQAYGLADREAGVPVAVSSRFRLASVSKQFTAAAILRLQDEGVLSVDDPLCRWIQPCPQAWAPIRLRHLLSHTSGVPDLMAQAGWGRRRVAPTTLADLTTASSFYRLQFEPGTKIRYSNAGYNLLAAVVEAAAGMEFHAWLQANFFTPLGMHDTGYDGSDTIVMGYADLAGGITPQPNANVSVITGAGALYSTVDDLLVWNRALHGGDLLSDESYADMIRDHGPADAPPERGRPRRDWGFGLFANRLGDRVTPGFPDRQIYHTGSWSGFRNMVVHQPDGDVTVIVLSNNYHRQPEVLLISQQALAEALGRPFPTALLR